MEKSAKSMKPPGTDGRISEEKSRAGIAQYLLFLRHKKAYIFAGNAEYCRDKTVLDYGCGSGYGSFFLAKTAKKVTAVDIDRTIIEECKKKYRADNLSFEVIDPETGTGFADRSFDLILSFQVIEHVHDVKGYLNELKRMLTDKGVLIITTPNRKHRLYPFQKPVNPYHIREYDFKTLSRQLREVFAHVTISGITGTKEIKRIERKRVKKSLIRALLRNPLKRFIRFKEKCCPTEESTEELESINRYTVDDYEIIAENPDTGLDFLALLRKT